MATGVLSPLWPCGLILPPAGGCLHAHSLIGLGPLAPWWRGAVAGLPRAGAFLWVIVQLVRTRFCQFDLSPHGPWTWTWTWKGAWKGAGCCPTPSAPHETRLVVHGCGYAPLAFCRRERLSTNWGQSCVGAPCLPACARGTHCPGCCPHVQPARGSQGEAAPHPGRRVVPHRAGPRPSCAQQRRTCSPKLIGIF